MLLLHKRNKSVLKITFNIQFVLLKKKIFKKLRLILSYFTRPYNKLNMYFYHVNHYKKKNLPYFQVIHEFL